MGYALEGEDNQLNNVLRRWDVGRDGGEIEKKLDGLWCGAVRRQWSGIEASARTCQRCAGMEVAGRRSKRDLQQRYISPL